MVYPICKKEAYSEGFFGHQLDDPYHWLKNAGNAQVMDWVAKENRFTDSWFDRKELSKKIAELKRDKPASIWQDLSPWEEGYAATKQDDGDYQLYQLDQNLQPQKLVMEYATMGNYKPYQLKPCPVDPDYIMIVGSYDGDARMTPLVASRNSRKILREITDVFFPCWSPTQKAVYIPQTVANPKTQESQIKILRWNAVSGEEETILVTEGIIGEIFASSDGGSVIFEIWKDYTVSFFFRYDETTGKLTDITEGKAVQMKYGDSIGNTHYFVSKEKAGNGEILAVAEGETLTDGTTVLGEDSETLEACFALEGRLFVLSTEKACYRLSRVKDGRKEEIPLPEKVCTLALTGRGAEKVFLKYESFTQAPLLLAFDGEKLDAVCRSRETEYPDVIVEQCTAASKSDGTEIPYFLVRRRDTEPKSDVPAVIYAYGGYNCSMYPWAYDMVTNLDVAKWAEQGGIYVMANIRGGAEFGAKWHEEGMLMKKRNCYDDFIGVAEKLIADGWTNPAKLAIDGCSNGGLLMSALVTMRPDLFGCVIDSVPHTDMIHFAEDDRGPMYITEYGNPKESKEMFEYLLSYSPYHNVKAAAYPPTYIQTGECDNNVPPYHGKKFAARMQEMTTGDAPILLRVLEKGSHDRGTGEAFWRTTAEMQLFMEKALELKK